MTGPIDQTDQYWKKTMVTQTDRQWQPNWTRRTDWRTRPMTKNPDDPVVNDPAMTQWRAQLVDRRSPVTGPDWSQKDQWPMTQTDSQLIVNEKTDEANWPTRLKPRRTVMTQAWRTRQRKPRLWVEESPVTRPNDPVEEADPDGLTDQTQWTTQLKDPTGQWPDSWPNW